MTYPRKGSSSKGKKKLLQEGKADLIADDPTSVFFSALQHSHPVALAALADYCARQQDVGAGLEKPQPSADPEVVSEPEVPAEPECVKHSEQLVQNEEGPKAQQSFEPLDGSKSDSTPEQAAEAVSNDEATRPVEPVEDTTADYPVVGNNAEPVLEKNLESACSAAPVLEPALEPDFEPEVDLAPEFTPEPTHETATELVPEAEPGAVPEPEVEFAQEPRATPKLESEPAQEPGAMPEPEAESAQEPGAMPEPDAGPVANPESVAELESEPDSILETVAEPGPVAQPGPAAEFEPSATDEKQPEVTLDAQSNEKTAEEPTSLPVKPAQPIKAPLRIEAAPKEAPPNEAPQRKGSPLSGEAIEAIPHAHTKGIQEEFKGVYEKVTQRGGVFDAKSRDAFSSESEKKVRSSYLGLKAISFDEALTAQSEKDPSLLRAQLEPESVLEPPPTIVDKAKAVFSVVDMMHKTPVIIATSLVCLSFLGFFVGNLYRAEGYLEEGESLFGFRKYPEAIKALSQAISLNPLRARAYFIRGRSYNKVGETGKAINDFSTSLQINPNSPEVLDHRASIHMRGGRYDKALADYRNILRLKPDEKEVHVFDNAALAARQDGKFEEALTFYDKALSVAANDKNALIGKALCEISLLQYGKAIELCNAIMRSDPQFLEAYVTRGWCYMSLKRDSAAMRDFDFVLARMPLNARASLNRGHLFYKAGRLDDAVRDYSTAIAGDPGFIEARSARAWAVLSSNPKLALADLKAVTASEQQKHSVKFWTLRAQLEAQLGKNLDAAQSYRRTIKLAKQFEPSSLPLLYARLGAVFTSLRQFDKAVEACDEALKLDPRNSLALSIRGFANESGGNGISALADYSKALSVSPKMPEALMYRAQHYIKKNEFHSAQRDLNDYLSVRADDQNAKKLLAMVGKKTASSSGLADAGTTKRRKYISVPFAQLLSGGISELNKGNTETAADMLTEAVLQNPSDSTARRYLCHALVREDPRAAVVQFDALRAAGPLPPDDERSYRHALSLAATGTLVEAAAIDKALRVVQEEPGNAQACYKLSTLYAAAGMLSKAAQFCQTGLSNAKSPAETKKFQDLYERLNKQNIQGEHKEDIEG